MGIAELPEREPSEQASVPARTDGSSRRVALTTLALTLTNGLSVLSKTQATHRGVTAAGFALSLAPDRKGDSLFAALMSHGTESAPPPPPAPSATWSAADTATVGVAAAGAITNTGEVSLPWSFASQANLTITPSSGTLAAGGTQPLSIVAAAAATYVMTLVSAGASITGNDQTMVATVAAVAPTSATLSGSSSATTGVAHTSTVTLDHPADQAYTITWSRTGGATGVSTSTITTGQTAVSADDTWATAGSGSVDFTISPIITRSGRPLSVTIADPAAPGALPSFTLAPAVSGTLPFAFGHAFRQGDVPAGQVANAASATDWQCTPMTYWPDGSLKHAIIAGRAAVTSGVDLALALTAGAAAGGAALTEANLASALPATTIAVDADTTDLNALIGTAALHTTVCTGPVMSSWVYRRPVSGNNHLVVFVEVRLFKGGEVEIFPWVENGYLSVASPTNFVRTCTVTIGGVSRFSQSIDIKHHTRVPLITGSAFSYWVGSDPQIKPKHDRDYLISTKLIPNLAAAAPAGATLDALQQTYAPNTLAGDTTANGAAGGEGGVVSVPSAYYVTSSADTRAYSAMMVHALSSGSWSHHYRDEATNLPIAFSAQPLATLADTSTPTIPTPTGGENAAGPAMSHSVSYAYLPWLVTGRWWFLEELHFWATYGYLSTSAAYRGNGAGWHVHAQPRFRAWSLNVLAQSASVTPASHPLRAEFLASWEANTSRHYGRFVSGTVDSGTWVSPIGVLGTYSGAIGQPSPFPPPIPATPPALNAWWDGIYQQNYLATVFGYTRDIGIPQSAQSLSDHVAVSNHAYKLVVGRADDGLQGRYNWRRFIAYGMPVGTDDAGIPLDTWYSTHDQAYAELVRGYGLATLDPSYGGTLKKHSEDNDLGGSSLTYGSTALAALALAMDHGFPGANQGWYRVSGASNFSLFDAYFSDEAPYWGIRPRAAEWLPAIGTVANLTSQTVDQVAGSGRTYWVAYGGVCPAPFWGKYGSIVAMGGGHGDGDKNDQYRIDVETGSITQIKPAAPAYAGPNAEAGDLTTGWMWTSAAGTDVQVGEPMTCHRHASLLHLPEWVWPGLGATNGWLYEAWAGAVPYTGNGSCVTAHRIRTGIDATWTIHGSANAPSVRIQGFWFHQSYGAAFDERRLKVWYQASATVSGGFPSSVLGSRDLANNSALGDTTFTPQAPAAAFNASYETLERSERHDLMFSTGKTAGGNYSRLVVWDPVDNKMFEPAQTGGDAVPTLGDNTARGWSDKLNAFAFYPGRGNTIYFLKPTGNPRTAAWAWSSRTFTGTVAEFPVGPQPGFNRLVPLPLLPDACMAWCCTTQQTVQIIHVAVP